MIDYRGKTVFVTGGSAGIGLAAARLFALRGARVAVFARGRERLAKAVEDIRAAPDQAVEGLPLDVADHEAVKETLGGAILRLGVPDVLLNCAGRAIPRRFAEVSFAQFEETMRINLAGTWNPVAAVAPAMMEQGSGHIVNTSSVAGLVGVYGYTDYAASKFAVLGFSEALRSELAPCGVKVQVLCPPDTDTPGFAVENRTKPPETHAVSGKAKVVTADFVARALLSGMEKGRFLILPGFDAKSVWIAKRLAPGLVFRIMDGAVRKCRKERP